MYMSALSVYTVPLGTNAALTCNLCRSEMINQYNRFLIDFLALMINFLKLINCSRWVNNSCSHWRMKKTDINRGSRFHGNFAARAGKWLYMYWTCYIFDCCSTANLDWMLASRGPKHILMQIFLFSLLQLVMKINQIKQFLKND